MRNPLDWIKSFVVPDPHPKSAFIKFEAEKNGRFVGSCQWCYFKAEASSSNELGQILWDHQSQFSDIDLQDFVSFYESEAALEYMRALLVFTAEMQTSHRSAVASGWSDEAAKSFWKDNHPLGKNGQALTEATGRARVLRAKADTCRAHNRVLKAAPNQ